eukprot:gene7692-biopygen4576
MELEREKLNLPDSRDFRGKRVSFIPSCCDTFQRTTNTPTFTGACIRSQPTRARVSPRTCARARALLVVAQRFRGVAGLAAARAHSPAHGASLRVPAGEQGLNAAHSRCGTLAKQSITRATLAAMPCSPRGRRHRVCDIDGMATAELAAPMRLTPMYPAVLSERRDVGNKINAQAFVGVNADTLPRAAF